jgi:hypothetical protein
MTVSMPQLADKLHRMGFSRFEDYSGNSKYTAQRNLDGRTHYCDDSTLRYFHARITGCAPSHDGLILRVTESVSTDSFNKKRGFRCVAFDVFGEAIYRPELEQCVSTSAQAQAAYNAWRNAFDLAAHYRTALSARAKRLDREAAELRQAINLADFN